MDLARIDVDVSFISQHQALYRSLVEVLSYQNLVSLTFGVTGIALYELL